MTQSSAAAPGVTTAPANQSAAPPPTANRTVPSTGPTLTPAPADAHSDTPRLLRRLTTGLILVCLVFGLAGALSFAGEAYSLHRAQADTDQLIRVQQIQTNLLSADATATNAFLVGGLEPPAQRATYDRAVATTTALIAEASEAQPADEAALTALNQDVVSYAVSIEQARANNRQGFPVGAQYLRNASASLRADALPILDQLVAANSSRADDAMGTRVGLVFEIVGLLALAALVAALVWLARRFRRRLNVGLVAAAAVVFVLWLAGVVTLVGVGRSVNDLNEGSFRDVNAAAASRIQGNNAKSNESLTLIARGSGTAFESAWSASSQAVKRELQELADPGLSSSWQSYVATHKQIRQLDNGGSWDRAVAQATGAGPTSSNTRFGAFDRAVSSVLEASSRDTSNGLAAPQTLLVVLAVLSLLAGIAAALLARRGVGARLKEYR